MSELRRGFIIEVALETSKGSETGKTEPCIIVTNNIYNERVPVIQVVPLTEWSLRKSKIKTNIEIVASPVNGLNNRSIADCLQTRPIDHQKRLVSIRGELEPEIMEKINHALKVVFDIL